ERKLKSRMLLQIHDELVFETPPQEEAALAALVREEMTAPLEKALRLRVPLKVDLAAGPNWVDVGGLKSRAAGGGGGGGGVGTPGLAGEWVDGEPRIFMTSATHHLAPETPRRPRVVGVVGGIGSGKSRVTRILADAGAFVISGDELAHEALR